MRRTLPILLAVLFAVTACVPIPPLPPATISAPAATIPAPTATLAAPAATLPAPAPTAPAPEATTVPPAPEQTGTPGPAAPAAAPIDLTERLPLDPAIRTGKLENGLTYYIRQNAEPAKRAELWLAVNAGSVMEADNQKGLAHFLEHMLFKGTKRFPGPALLNFLESIGMKFGPDINAYTSFDETVYTLQIPTDKETDVSQALDVLQDWAGAATLSAQDFDKERGVIVEEWRLRDQTASGRMQDKIVPLLLGDSQYAKRLPIGDMDIVRNAPVQTLRDFYQKWYRPDLMAVIAVGDFDVDQVESLIQERFSQLPKPGPQAAPRPSFDVPARQGTSALVVKDPENPYTVASIYQSRPARKLETVGQYRDLLLDYLVTIMLNQRYAEVAQQANAPFLQAQAGNENLVRPTDVYGLSAVVKEGQSIAGLDALMTEFERARRYGFTAGEMERARNDLLAFYESAEKERKTSNSSGYANEYVQLFLNNIASPGIDYEYALVQRLLPGITLDDANQRIANLVTPNNRAIILQAPDKADLELPTEAELTAAVDAVAAKQLQPYVDVVAQTALMDKKPAPAAIVSEKTLPDLGVTEFTLANGVNVIMKPTAFKKDEVVFSATSPGGTSLVSDADYPDAAVAAPWIDQSGVGSLNQTELTKLLSGKIVSVSPVIGELKEGFSGSASPDDLETALQLVYLYATQPREDDNSFQVLRNQLETSLQNRSLDPESGFQDALTAILCGKSVRCGPLPLDQVSKLDEQKTFQIYRDRFADFSDFTFTFVGSFDPATLKTLAQTYLGNLPSTGRKETWRDVRAPLPTTIVDDTVHKGLDPRAHTRIVFTGPISPTLENEVMLNVLENVLDLRVVDELRQQLGATYSPQAATSLERLPKPTYRALIDFVSDPTRVKELTGATFKLLDDLRTNGPSEADVNKAKEQARLARQKALEDNSFWLKQLQDHLTTPGDDGSDILRYDAALSAVTAESVQKAAQTYLPADRYVEVVLYPEKFNENGSQ
jgi:zinc protease